VRSEDSDEHQTDTEHHAGWNSRSIHYPEYYARGADLFILDTVDVRGLVDLPDFIGRHIPGLVAARQLPEIKAQQGSAPVEKRPDSSVGKWSFSLAVEEGLIC
jgi:hypothetical protein